MENSLSPEREESATVNAASALPHHLSGTIYHDISEISREQFAPDLKIVLFARAYSSEAPLRTSV